MKSRRDLLDALDQLVKAVAGARGSDEAQMLLAGIEESGEGVLGELVRFCQRLGDETAADFLALTSILANDVKAREQAREVLAQLEARGVSPRSAFLPALRQKRLAAAYVVSLGRGEGHRLLTLWRRERGLAQAYLFSLDGEGALVGFEASRNLSASQVEEMTRAGGVKVNAKEAASLVRRSLTVARAKGLELPAGYLRQHRFVEESIFAR